MKTQLSILNKSIRTYNNLYSLNDLHVSSGNEPKHRPNQFIRLDQTKELIAEIESENSSAQICAVHSINGGANRGTYACQEIVIAYAAWISASFHLKVIRAFMDVNNIPHSTKSQTVLLTKPHQITIKELVLGRVKNLPKEQQAGIIIKQWSALKTHFGKSYKDIDDSQFTEAVSLLARLPLEGELIDTPLLPPVSENDISVDKALFCTLVHYAQKARKFADKVEFKHRQLFELLNIDFRLKNDLAGEAYDIAKEFNYWIDEAITIAEKYRQPGRNSIGR